MGIEFAKDGTLLDLTRRIKSSRKPLKDEQCSQIIKSVLLGLKHIHRCDYVHRDLKPSNIVISDRKDYTQIKLVDFGLAVKY
jgi:serine/threonine protein kinase